MCVSELVREGEKERERERERERGRERGREGGGREGGRERGRKRKREREERREGGREGGREREEKREGERERKRGGPCNVMKTLLKICIVFNDSLTGREKQTYSKTNTHYIDHVNRFQNHVSHTCLSSAASESW